MMAILNANKRRATGKREARALRKRGLVPCIIYGHGRDTVAVAINRHDLDLAVLHGQRLLEIDVEDKKENVLIKDLQWDTFGHEILHMDLTRVNLDERVTIAIPIVLRGTPVGLSQDGVLQQMNSEVNVECLVRDMPEEIRVMVTDLKVGDSILMRDLELPEGVKLLDNEDTRVCSVNVIAEEEEAEAVEEEAQGAQPEVIGEKTEEDEAEDDVSS
ncbi:MAG: 50S ribosomal protein L25 [Planctomycetes bacterium]|nr:50S ribosomal protein L25 [Planctomycetota bacterium]